MAGEGLLGPMEEERVFPYRKFTGAVMYRRSEIRFS